MKRRTFRKLHGKQQPERHHSVYVVLLDPAAVRLRAVRAINRRRDPKKPCVYVGMTGLTPEERFANHKAGTKAASVVKRYGLRPQPDRVPRATAQATKNFLMLSSIDIFCT
jgi:hypothetical protein